MLSKLLKALKRTESNSKKDQETSFIGSSRYWEERYKSGGNSGSGSYGRLAIFKAEFLNEFVSSENIVSVVEFGCGDGAQLLLSNYRKYVGYDVSKAAIELCKHKFIENKNYDFYETKQTCTDEGKFDLAISLDVIYHLVEDEVFEAYMHRLFRASKKFVIIYSSNIDSVTEAPHEKRRNFIKWINGNIDQWKLIKTVPNIFPFDEKNPQNTSLSDFYIFKRVTTYSNG